MTDGRASERGMRSESRYGIIKSYQFFRRFRADLGTKSPKWAGLHPSPQSLSSKMSAWSASCRHFSQSYNNPSEMASFNRPDAPRQFRLISLEKPLDKALLQVYDGCEFRSAPKMRS